MAGVTTSVQVDGIYRLLTGLIDLPQEQWLWLQTQLQQRCFVAGESMFRPGDTDGGIHYLMSGLVRYYYLTEDGRERNHNFAAEGNLVGCLPVFLGKGPCDFTVSALEPVSTLLIPASVMLSDNPHHSCWTELRLRLLEHVAARKQVREAEFLLDDAETRYRNFCQRHSAILQRIPQYHIASYLGITPVALSRIRRRINLG